MNAISEKKINIYGNGKQIRNWIHVEDHNEGVIKIIKKGKKYKKVNFLLRTVR